MKTPGLRSARETVGGLAHFPRMLDKVRLHAAGKLPEDFHPYLGDAPGDGETAHTRWDSRCCRFLRVDYGALRKETLGGAPDEALLEWAFANGRRPNAEEIDIWSAFLLKRGWRDATAAGLLETTRKLGRPDGEIVTWVDLKDAEEDLPLRFSGGDGVAAGGVPSHVTPLPGLRSPYEMVGGIVHFGRMLDKIRALAAGKLPAGWLDSKGKGYDGFTCRFLGTDYGALETEALRGGSDDAVLQWAFDHGRKPSPEEVEIWNAYMMKRNWRDAHAERLHFRLAEIGLPPGSYLTMFDFIDVDEGRPQRFVAVG